MGRNVEIKARARDFEAQARLAERLADGPARRMIQEDTFFNASAGRLKLRVCEDGTGELIQYERVDAGGPKESRYIRIPVTDPQTLKQALANAIGIRAVVRKKRTVFLSGRTRIHLDDVESLGTFLELEVVLEPAEEFARGVAIADELMSKLGIEKDDLIAAAYVDLLAQ